MGKSEAEERKRIAGDLVLGALNTLSGCATPTQIIAEIKNHHDEYNDEEIKEMVQEVLFIGKKYGFLKANIYNEYTTKILDDDDDYIIDEK